MKTKVCKVCGDEKLIEAMLPGANLCRVCSIEALREWELANPEKARAARAKYAATPGAKEKNRQACKAYYAKLSPLAKRVMFDRKNELRRAAAVKSAREMKQRALHIATRYLRRSVEAALGRAVARVQPKALTDLLAENYRTNGRECYCTTCKMRRHNRFHVKTGTYCFSKKCIYCILGVEV